MYENGIIKKLITFLVGHIKKGLVK